jgi:hypothetical protein
VKLWQKLCSIEFSDSEKDRISSCLRDSQSRQQQVLTGSAPGIHDNDFWRGAQRSFRVKGFRDGHLGAIQKVIERALAAAKIHSSLDPHGDWPHIWPLYQRTVRFYIQDEAPSLAELLKREEFQSGPGSVTDQILRSILKGFPLYKATAEQVRQLYELWGLERTSRVDEILSSNWVEADAVRRMVDEGVRAVRSEMSSSLASTRTDTQRRIDDQATEIRLLKGVTTGLRRELDDAISQLTDRISVGAVAKVVGLGPAWSPAHGDRRRKSAVPQVNPTVVDTVHARIESLGRQVKELRLRMEEREEGSRTAGASRSSQPEMTTALKAINKWSEGLRQAGISGNTVTAGRILVEVIRRSRVILTDKPGLMTSLVGALPQGECRTLVASPLWLTELDWKEGLAFISEDVGIPRVLLITDFDVALQETSLVPPLIAWALAVSPTCANRVVLVPTDSELSSVSPRILELATVLTQNAPYIQDLTRLCAAITHSSPTLEDTQSGASFLGYLRSKNAASDTQLVKYARNYGVSLPSRVVENFISLDDGLLALLGARDARYVAQEAALMPWVERARGEAVSRILREALQVLRVE